jgi:hypothetical protein
MELPRGTYRDALRPSLDDPGRGHSVLRLERLHHLILVQAQRRQLARREIEVDDFILRTDHLHLAQVRHGADIGADLLHVVTQLPLGQAVGGEGIDGAEHVAELIIEGRSLQPLGEFAADVIDFLAHLVPDLRDGLGTGGVAQIDEHCRFARTRVALGVIQGVELFELLLDSISDLLEGFLLGRAGPTGLDDHGLDGEGGILLAPQVEIGKHAHQQPDKHQVPHERLVLDGPAGQVETPFHRGPSSSIFIFWPGLRLCTPAVTTRSPGFTPLPIRAWVALRDSIWTSRGSTLPACGSTIQT